MEIIPLIDWIQKEFSKIKTYSFKKENEYFKYYNGLLYLLNDDQLIKFFNENTNTHFSNNALKGYLSAISYQFKERKIDFSEIINERKLTHINKIILTNNKIIIKTVKVFFEGVEVIGEIESLDKFFIQVKIISPYCNWDDCSGINGFATKNPNNFMVTYKEVSKRLLLQSYRKLKLIDESLERICSVYDNLLLEISQVNKLNDIKIKDSIIFKLNEWFFGKFIFVSSITNLTADADEKSRIIKIIEIFKAEKRKIYIMDTK